MSKRSNKKQITKGARALRFMREQAKLSLRTAAEKTGLSMSLVAHLEQGRTGILPHHLEKLVSVYGSTIQNHLMFESGATSLPQDVRSECLEIVRSMSLEQLRIVHPVLITLKQRH